MVIIISKDEDLIFVAFQVVTPSFKGFNNSLELLIVIFISSLGGYYFSKIKSYKVLSTNFGCRRIYIFVSHVIEKILI